MYKNWQRGLFANQMDPSYNSAYAMEQIPENAVLIITDNAFIGAVVRHKNIDSKMHVSLLPKKQLPKMAVQNLKKYQKILIDSNAVEDLQTYSKFLAEIPQITVLGSYDFPLDAVDQGMHASFMIKSVFLQKAMRPI